MTAALDHQATARAALDDAVRRAGRLTAGAGGLTDTRPPLPITPALTPLLPLGLRRGTSVGVSGGVASTSLTLALAGAASAAGSWCALVGLPALTAEALTGYGLDLERLAVVPAEALGSHGAHSAGWTTTVGALVDAVDVVIVRPPSRLPDGDVRRLTARARTRGAVLVVVSPGGAGWPGLDVRLSARHVAWDGMTSTTGHGRLRARRVEVHGTGRGVSGGGAGRAVDVWLPSRAGGVEAVSTTTVPGTVTPLRRVG